MAMAARWEWPPWCLNFKSPNIEAAQSCWGVWGGLGWQRMAGATHSDTDLQTQNQTLAEPTIFVVDEKLIFGNAG